MNNKHALAFFLVLPFFFLGCMIFNSQQNLASGKTVIIRMDGFDPFDIISGHYLNLRPNFSQTDCSQFNDNSCPSEQFNYRYKYYLPEFDAKEIDRLILMAKPQIDLVFTYRELGKPIVKNLLLDNMEWKDWLKKVKQSSELPVSPKTTD